MAIKQVSLKQQGYTLMEAVIIIVLGTILFVAVLRFLPDESLQTDSYAERLKTDIRYVQIISMYRNESYRINFSGSSYNFTKADGTTAVNHPYLSSNTVNLASGVALTTTNLPNSYILFDKDGIPYTDTSGTALSSTAKVTLTDTGKSYTVHVTPETGKATLLAGT